MYSEIYASQLGYGQEIILYQAPVSQKPITKSIAKPVGVLFLLVSFLSLFSLAGPLVINEISYRFKPEVVSPVKVEAQVSQRPITVEKFELVIPKLHITAPVVANVDPADEKAYSSALKNGIAHAKGSSFPGQKGSVYLFAHSSNYVWETSPYRAVFYRLNDLQKTDKIVIAFNGKVYLYEILDKKYVKGGEVSWLMPSVDQGEKRLVLQTCWPPLTDWQRLVIIAQPIDSGDELLASTTL